MGTTLGRRIDAFLSSISNHHPFRYRETNNSGQHHQIYYHNMTKSRPLSLQVVELKVRMCCEGCERVVKDAALKLRGVDSVEVDLPMERVTVTGYVDRNKVLKAVRRSGKKAEFWPNPDLPRYYTTASDYFHDEETFRESYNYWRHGYNGDKHGHVPVPQRGDDRVSNFFNDDDVNACAVM
ncbi:hypothetical protein Taro_054408 [Colocasia esculenta]|uniref:HMA domain-containing protein n=1 Tax=Colocasia esculenta TaxID=4460 RepID=A0A843XNR6_COLES|nr:hypothetical protein [Colocasia esculenta]